MRHLIAGAAMVAMAVATPTGAFADTIVNISGSMTGCTTCSGGHPTAGDTVGTLIDPVYATFDAGTYTVTNAVGRAGATPGYDAWNFNTGSDQNWIWSFIIVDPATNKVVLDSLPDPNAFVGAHAAVAGASYALNYSGTFTLGTTTRLAFITEDYYPSDNAGGVSLDVALAQTGGVPEPASWAMLVLGLGAAGYVMRRRRGTTAVALAT